MSKKTNDFQNLVKIIYEKIVPEGGKVTESGLVYDKEAGILREVDILVEFKYADHKFSFIVECRDRSRSSTVEWIDGLIGKAKSLKVNKIIAVSNKGFTVSAERKARENGIETFTLEAAKEIDWLKFPIRPGLFVMTDDIYRLHDVLIIDDKSYVPIATLGLDSTIEVKGKVIGDLHGFIEFFFKEYVVKQITEQKNKDFLKLFKSKKDVEKTLIAKIEYNWEEIYVVDKKGNRTELKKVKFIVHGNRKSMEVKQKHQVFNQKMVSTGRHLDSDGSIIKFYVIQDPETNKLHLKWERKSKD